MTKEKYWTSCLLPGGVDDREPLKQETFFKNIKGKPYADKGYIGKMLFETLFVNGVQLITKVKNNMKNMLMSITDKILLTERVMVASLIRKCVF